METWRVATVSCVLTTLVACGSDIIVHRVDEREANRIIETLATEHIVSHKGMVDTGREVYFTIRVAANKRLQAIRVLNNNELPRRKDMGYNEIFGVDSGGLIPTSGEERAKQMAALEGEIQRQLKLINGILDVQAQIVSPEESALRTSQEQRPPTTASITIKYMPGAGGSKPLSEPQVQAIVAAGVEKLTPDRVVVVMTPAGGPSKIKSAASSRSGRWGGIKGVTQKQFNMIGMAVALVTLLLALGLVYAQLRLRSVRGRLMRLQTEIARARRKPGESSVTG